MKSFKEKKMQKNEKNNYETFIINFKLSTLKRNDLHRNLLFQSNNKINL